MSVLQSFKLQPDTKAIILTNDNEKKPPLLPNTVSFFSFLSYFLSIMVKGSVYLFISQYLYSSILYSSFYFTFKLLLPPIQIKESIFGFHTFLRIHKFQHNRWLRTKVVSNSQVRFNYYVLKRNIGLFICNGGNICLLQEKIRSLAEYF